MKRFIVAGLWLALSSGAGAANAPAKATAKQIFDDYQSLERNFDSGIADLYCDSALIRNTRRYPDGTERVMEIPAPKYKALIRASMPIAKAAGDYSNYSKVRYTVEGENVRIDAIRFGVVKKYSSPLSILVGACDGGKWAILEEISQSQP